MDLGKVIAHIPARGGSKRVPAKNLRFLAGKPMIAYAIESASGCPELEDVYVNTDSDNIALLSESLGCKVYRRPGYLGSDTATGEDFNEDFIRAKKPNTLVMISPVCPLIESEDISLALREFNNSDVDTLISCSVTRMQTFSNGTGVNCDPNQPLAPTQKNIPTIICNWAITIWNAKTFLSCYNKNKSGYFGKNRMFWPIDPLKAVKISEEKDFRMAESLLNSKRIIGKPEDHVIKYWSKS